MRRPIVYLSSLALLFVLGLSPALAQNNEVEGQLTAAEIIGNAEHFSQFATAIEIAGVTDTFQQGESYTVFAPTDEAFERLPDGTRERLFNDEELLRKILRFHVVEGEFTEDELTAHVEQKGVEPSLETLEGTSVWYEEAQHGLRIQNAIVMETDIEASNGVIHAIDTVLLPPSEDELVDR